MKLTTDELKRYIRQLNLPSFGVNGQEKLKKAKVLVVGAGGLGAPLLTYLAAAGVGTLGLIDFDVVDKTNLHRQIIYSENDVGKRKVKAAAERLQGLNSSIQVVAHDALLTSENAMEILQAYDIIADGTDNFPTRYLVNDACVLLNKTNVYGSIFRFEGQVSVFNHLRENGTRGPNYRDIFPEPPPPGSVPNCAEGGVLGILPGIIGTMQASEVIKAITGLGTLLDGKMFLFDCLSMESRTLKFKARADNPISGEQPSIRHLIDYDEFCGLKSMEMNMDKVNEITVKDLALWRKMEKPHQLIDVRESYELDVAYMEGEHIPQGEVLNRLADIRKDVPVVVHCRSGARSANVIQILQTMHGYENLLNLKGGILAWSDEIDESIAKY